METLRKKLWLGFSAQRFEKGNCLSDSGKWIFSVSIVFGEKATQEALHSDISEGIKKIISEAKVYAEGRGIRIEIKNSTVISDIKKLVLIKLKN